MLLGEYVVRAARQTRHSRHRPTGEREIPPASASPSMKRDFSHHGIFTSNYSHHFTAPIEGKETLYAPVR